MTEFEFYEAANMVYTGIPGAAMNFTYLVFAYTVAAYLAGQQLPRLIAVGASLVYTLALLGPFLGIVLGLAEYYRIGELYRGAYPKGQMIINPISQSVGYIVSASPLIIGWLASLGFAHGYVRGDSAPKG